jgi:DnaJ-class molecular chaperone
MNYYEILGIAPDASDVEIRIAYKRLAMKHHPDREGGDAAKFDAIQKAYKGLQNAVCPVCNGRGQVRERKGAFTRLVNCPRCWGKVKK